MLTLCDHSKRRSRFLRVHITLQEVKRQQENAPPIVIDKQAYYRGAAIFQLLHDERTVTIRPLRPGFLINDEVFSLIKYTARVTSPWHFTFSPAERNAIDQHRDHPVVIALVCGGDGVCAVLLDDVNAILDDPPTWISVSRKVNKRYKVNGSAGEMVRKVPRNRWPEIVFDGKAADNE
jgi:hypothetical protein